MIALSYLNRLGRNCAASGRFPDVGFVLLLLQRKDWKDNGVVLASRILPGDCVIVGKFSRRCDLIKPCISGTMISRGVPFLFPTGLH